MFNKQNIRPLKTSYSIGLKLRKTDLEPKKEEITYFNNK